MVSKLEICVSDRCFFPRSAFEGSRTTVERAKNLGYQKVEFHPTWAVWLESLVKGKLSCQSEDISSFHISWREDGRHNGYGFFKRNFLVPAYRIFPPEPFGTKTLQKLEKTYKKPVVVHWQEDFERFNLALLELHGPLGLDGDQVENEIEKGTIKGVVVDTDKFSDWLKTAGESKDQALQRLFHLIREVHFRFRDQRDFASLSQEQKSESVRLMEELVKMGYNGRVVVEIGWPDPESIEILRQVGQEEVHLRIVKFLQKL